MHIRCMSWAGCIAAIIGFFANAALADSLIVVDAAAVPVTYYDFHHDGTNPELEFRVSDWGNTRFKNGLNPGGIEILRQLLARRNEIIFDFDFARLMRDYYPWITRDVTIFPLPIDSRYRQFTSVTRKDIQG